MNEDDTLNVAAPGVLDNDTDANSDHLTAGVADDAQHRTLTLDPDGPFTYAPDADFHGTESFTYKANDGNLGSNTRTVTMTVSPMPDACTIGDTGKDDVLWGTAGRDVICGAGGNDTVHGDAGDDKLMGGDGRDRLYGEQGDDRRLFGGAGTDLLNGGSEVNFTQQ